MGAEPGGDAIGVTRELQFREVDIGGAMWLWALTWKQCALAPLDEEGVGGLRRRLLDPGQPPAQNLTVSSSS